MKRIWLRLKSLTANRSGIYLIPNRWGIVFFLVVATVFYIGMSYANNIMLALAFFLFSYFLILLVMAHFNLYRHQWNDLHIADHFGDQKVELSLWLKPFSLFVPRDIFIELKGEWGSTRFYPVTGEPMKRGRQRFFAGPMERGHYQGNRITLVSHYPLGLFYVWHSRELSFNFYIYPKRVFISHQHIKTQASEKMSMIQQGRGDEFYQHRSYQQECFHRMDWKLYAKRDELWLKDYRSPTQTVVSIRYGDFIQDQDELRLQKMAGLVHHCFQQQQLWSFELPQSQFQVAGDAHHYRQCLRSLSRYD
jgi:uncharacterized protein (DUF58 family)